MKHVLVLGGGGFIGRNIVKFLVERGDCNRSFKEGYSYKTESRRYTLLFITHKYSRASFSADMCQRTNVSRLRF